MTSDIILHNDEENGNILSSTPDRSVFFEGDSDTASPIISRRRHSRVLDSSVDEDEGSVHVSPATSMMRDDLDTPQEDAPTNDSHGDLEDQHDGAADQSLNTTGNQSLNSTGLNLHISQQDLIMDSEEPNISHSEFKANKDAVNEMRAHFGVKIKQLDKELIKKAARAYGFGDPLETDNCYRMHGYGKTMTCYISNSTTMIQPTNILFPTIKTNLDHVVKYMALVLELFQDPSKVEQSREEQRQAVARKRSYSGDQNEKSPIPRKRARRESPRRSTSRRGRRSLGTPSPRRNRSNYGSPARRGSYNPSRGRRGCYNSPIPRSESRPRTLRHPKHRKDNTELNLKVNTTPNRARERPKDADLSSNLTRKSNVHEGTSSKTQSKLKERSSRSSSGDGKDTPKPSTSRAATRHESPAASKQDTYKKKESLNSGPSSSNIEKADPKPTLVDRAPEQSCLNVQRSNW